MFPRVCEVRNLKDYNLEIHFSDGTVAELDFRRRVVGRRQQVLRRRRNRRQEGPRRQPERPTVLVQRRVDRRFGADATLPETRRRRRRLATGN